MAQIENLNMKKRTHSANSRQNLNLIYKPEFISTQDQKQIIHYLESLFPLWEMRFSKSNPPPENEDNRSLLRPVYWLGNWQFACLDYYHPPKGLKFRCSATAEALLLEANPAILQARSAVAGARAGMDIAGARPNPTLSAAVTSINPARNSAGGYWDRPMDSVLRLDQTFERGDKRELRLRAADRNLAATA